MVRETKTEYIGYEVTGLLYNSNKRFKPLRRQNLQDALFINLWNGSVWGLREDGTRKLILRIVN